MTNNTEEVETKSEKVFLQDFPIVPSALNFVLKERYSSVDTALTLMHYHFLSQILSAAAFVTQKELWLLLEKLYGRDNFYLSALYSYKT